MSQIKNSTLACPALLDAFTDFILYLQGKSARQQTLDFYFYTACKFLEWVENNHNVTNPNEITARHVREYIAMLVDKGLMEGTVWNHARAIKAMFKFLCAEGYMQAVKFDLPPKKRRRQPTLNAEQLEKVLKACNTRDKALVMFMADSGVRREGVIQMDWDDVDMQTGEVFVRVSKGGKQYATRVGARTRRALIAYRRTLPHEWRDGILFKTDEGTRFTGSGMLAVYKRLAKKTGIHVTPHAMRRTFAILFLRAGGDPGTAQGLGGWKSLDMVYYYAQLEKIDFLNAHKEHSPMDNLDKLKRQE